MNHGIYDQRSNLFVFANRFGIKIHNSWSTYKIYGYLLRKYEQAVAYRPFARISESRERVETIINEFRKLLS